MRPVTFWQKPAWGFPAVHSADQTATRRIAIISDTHGNLTATRAVLTDAATQHITDYAVLGDLLMPGPGAGDLIDLLQAVQPRIWLKGNWEQLIEAVLDERIDPHKPNNIYFAMLAGYTLDRLTPDQLAFLRSRPIADTWQVNGLTLGFTHNERDVASGHDLYPQMPQANFDHLLAPGQDVAVFGHIHQQLLRPTSKGQLILNPGAVGQPYSPWRHIFADQRASYAILQVDGRGYLDVTFRKVDYDQEAEIALATARNLPYLALYRHLRRTGRTVTHNQRLLARFNAACGYDAVVRDRWHNLEP